MPFINRVGTKVVETIEGGGGNAALAFSVNNYSTLPDTGAENEIAVITSASMTGWKVQAEAPTSPTEGLVWIDVGEGSPAPIQLDNVQISPIRAYQYVSGSWKSLDAYVRVGSSWTQFSRAKLEIFTDGVINTNVTDIVYDPHGGSSLDGTRLKVRTTASNAEGYAGTSSKINVSSYKSLCVQITCGSADSTCSYGLRSTHIPSDGSAGWFGTYVASKSLTMTASTQYTDSLDIESFNDSYYIVVSTVDPSKSTYVNKIWLE